MEDDKRHISTPGRTLVWNCLGLSPGMSGIARLASRYTLLVHDAVPTCKQIIVGHGDMDWLTELPATPLLVPRSKFSLVAGNRIPIASDSPHVHSWGSSRVIRGAKSSSYTVHDWGPFSDKSISARRRALWQHAIRRGIRRAGWVHSVSQQTASRTPRGFKQLILRRGLVIGIDHRHLSCVENEKPTALPADLGQFVLAVGTLDARKKLGELAELFRRRDDIPELVVAGAGTQVLAAGTRVYGLGYVTEKDLAWLYDNCLALCLPSDYEGIGLPALEALERRKPVIVTRTVKENIPGALSHLIFELEDGWAAEDLKHACEWAHEVPAVQVSDLICEVRSPFLDRLISIVRGTAHVR